MNFRREGAPADLRIEITPLIDVIFQLLIFFLLTTSFVTERALDIELPGADSRATSRERMTIVAVSITRDGRIAHDGVPVSWQELTDVFRRAAATDSERVVLVRGDHAATHGRVVQVMDLARLHGLTKLAIATAPRSAEANGTPQHRGGSP